jgi:hypothetical protein
MIRECWFMRGVPPTPFLSTGEDGPAKKPWTLPHQPRVFALPVTGHSERGDLTAFPSDVLQSVRELECGSVAGD